MYKKISNWLDRVSKPTIMSVSQAAPVTDKVSIGPVATHNTMKLEVLRFSSQKDSTNGILFDITGGQRKFLCYTLEDEYRPLESKVMGETRIPAGTYNVTLRTVGGFHGRYTERYGDMHKGMLWVRDVPGFEYILIHSGNTDEHTAGCLLVGDSQNENITKKDGFIGASRTAYERIYPPVADALVSGKKVTITYTDFDTI
jgi:hypothetical protein